MESSFGGGDCTDDDSCALNTLKVIPGPMGMGDWAIVANANQDIYSAQVRPGEELSSWQCGQACGDLMWSMGDYSMTGLLYTDGSGGTDLMAAGQDHELFVVYTMSGEKPCIEQGDDTYLWDMVYMPIDFVSDDFCGSGGDGGLTNDPEDYTGDQDPGAGYGPDRMWLSYDDMDGEWIVNGKWQHPLTGAYAAVENATSIYSSVWLTGQYENTMMGTWYDSMYEEMELPPGEGELFRFVYTGEGVPCLNRRDSSGMENTRLYNDSWGEADLRSRNWCGGEDTPHVDAIRLEHVGGNEYQVVVRGDTDLTTVQLLFAGDFDMVNSQPDHLSDQGWELYDWSPMVYLNAGTSGNTLPAGEDHRLWTVSGMSEKPCIERGYQSYVYGDSEFQHFASDDYCHGADVAWNYRGDQDPGAGYGPQPDVAVVRRHDERVECARQVGRGDRPGQRGRLGPRVGLPERRVGY
jgi:hypothetical protein